MLNKKSLTLSILATLFISNYAMASDNFNGRSVTATNGVIAIGDNAHIGSRGAIAIGNDAYTGNNNTHSIAIGHNASAVNGIAIGANSISNSTHTVSFGGNVSPTGQKITRRLTNISTGINDTDAVNVGQLHPLEKKISNNEEKISNNNNEIKQTQATLSKGLKDTLQSANHYTDSKIQTITQGNNNNIVSYVDHSNQQTLLSANSYTNSKFNQLDNKINQVKSEANAGTASAIAIGMIPAIPKGYDYSVGVGFGTYGGQNAIAVGAKLDLAKNLSANLSSSYDSQHNFGGGVGLGYGF